MNHVTEVRTPLFFNKSLISLVSQKIVILFRPAFHGREIARGMDMRTDAKKLIYVKIHEPFPWSRFRARTGPRAD